ncbi:TetR/AcrR family transcriptional repressor of lmrAB and yxaGH operons [Kitasatospora sp. MAP12-15]|uniref:TetR/AcrR family transcriptional regulator n=1 Tax=unclassified Kitasatospora TaxID=2633591 RepID=UPI002476983F|nr:TetR/AcrR family transcriptional regulator [Kitasatospora sp. MAP12-44]MDH6109248.1 TetR/AcrR family transcriptional repressor of lmrAB and yxaGH operons [Kitasatospora sp. MAP12-44]
MARDDPDARSRLLATAGVLFKRQGYASTGVKQLLDTSGTVAGSLYHHFPGGKEEVALAVIMQAGQDITRALSTALTALGTAGGLDRFISHLASTMDATGGLEGCPIAPVAVESPTAGEAVRRAAAGQFAAWTDAIAAQLRSEGHPPESARTLAQVLLAALEGALLLDRTAGDTIALTALRSTLPALLRAAVVS